SPSARTRSRSPGGASLGIARSSRTSSANSRSKSTVSDAGIVHHLLESLQCAAEPRRARRLADPEQARRRRAVELEQHTQRNHLTVGRRKRVERRRERAFPVHSLLGFGQLARVSRLAPAPSLLGAEVVERNTARDLAQPRARGAATRVEPSPDAE